VQIFTRPIIDGMLITSGIAMIQDPIASDGMCVHVLVVGSRAGAVRPALAPPAAPLSWSALSAC